jgi:hypothetical protein
VWKAIVHPFDGFSATIALSLSPDVELDRARVGSRIETAAVSVAGQLLAPEVVAAFSKRQGDAVVCELAIDDLMSPRIEHAHMPDRAFDIHALRLWIENMFHAERGISR